MAEFAMVAVITILAVISPGPDFVMVSRNSLAFSRQAGMLTATGIGIGVLVHVAYTIVGVGFLLQNSPSLFFCFKMAGAAYLVWMGNHVVLQRPDNSSNPGGLHFDKYCGLAHGHTHQCIKSENIRVYSQLVHAGCATGFRFAQVDVLRGIYFHDPYCLVSFSRLFFVRGVRAGQSFQGSEMD